MVWRANIGSKTHNTNQIKCSHKHRKRKSLGAHIHFPNGNGTKRNVVKMLQASTNLKLNKQKLWLENLLKFFDLVNYKGKQPQVAVAHVFSFFCSCSFLSVCCTNENKSILWFKVIKLHALLYIICTQKRIAQHFHNDSGMIYLVCKWKWNLLCDF